MKTPRLPKLCIFCGKDRNWGKMTPEHFVMQGLWAGARPRQTRTAFAHKTCNNAFSADNEYFRDVMAIDAARISQHPDAVFLLNEKCDISKTLGRPKTARKFTPLGLYAGTHQFFPVQVSRIKRVLQHVVKGVYYTARKELLPENSIIEISPLDDLPPSKELRLVIEAMTDWQCFGDDVFCCRYITGQNVTRITCLLQFYRGRLFYGEAFTPGLLKEIALRNGDSM